MRKKKKREEYSRLDDWEKKKTEKANTKRKRIGETELGLGGGKRRKKEKKTYRYKRWNENGERKGTGKKMRK